MTPGKVYPLAFDVGWLSQVFNRGHRIRVTVASSGAPFYEPNPNTGEPLTIEPPAETRRRPQRRTSRPGPCVANLGPRTPRAISNQRHHAVQQ